MGGAYFSALTVPDKPLDQVSVWKWDNIYLALVLSTRTLWRGRCRYSQPSAPSLMGLWRTSPKWLQIKQPSRKAVWFSHSCKIWYTGARITTRESSKWLGSHSPSWAKLWRGMGAITIQASIMLLLPLVIYYSLFAIPKLSTKDNLQWCSTGECYEEIGRLYEEQPRLDWEHLADMMHDYKGLLAGWPQVLHIHSVCSLHFVN